MILEIMAETLEDAAYNVLTASDGHEALSLLRAMPNHFTMLISDIHMPGGIDGLEGGVRGAAASAGAADHPGHGPAGRAGCADGSGRRGYALLRKPYGPGQLTALVQRHVRTIRAGLIGQ